MSEDSISKLKVNHKYPFDYRLAYQSNLINNNPNAYDLISNDPLKYKLRQYLKAHDYVANSIELSNRINEQYGVPLQIMDHFIISCSPTDLMIFFYTLSRT